MAESIAAATSSLVIAAGRELAACGEKVTGAADADAVMLSGPVDAIRGDLDAASVAGATGGAAGATIGADGAASATPATAATATAPVAVVAEDDEDDADEAEDDDEDDADEADDWEWPSFETRMQSGFCDLSGDVSVPRFPMRFEQHDSLVQEHVAKFLLTCSACGREGRVSNTAATAAIPAALCSAVTDNENLKYLKDLGPEKLVACLKSLGMTSFDKVLEWDDDEEKKAYLADCVGIFTEGAADSVRTHVEALLDFTPPLRYCCGKANYCDRKCQVAHWEASHKSVCKAASSPAPPAASRSPPASPQGRG
jgi:hypothetical protein